MEHSIGARVDVNPVYVLQSTLRGMSNHDKASKLHHRRVKPTNWTSEFERVENTHS
jgi:hypothetical protein